MKSYNSIKEEIKSLPRQEQYQHLLNTKEWLNFRDKIVALDHNKCTKCDAVEGISEIPLSPDTLKEQIEEVTKHNSDFKKKIKDPEYIEKQIQILTGLSNEPLEGLRSYPVSTISGPRIKLHLHHKLYINTKLPWEYSRKHLETVCSNCHTKIHSNTDIFTYKDEKLNERKAFPKCLKCNGEGYLPKYDYRDKGICYECGGEGILYNESMEWTQVTNDDHIF